MVCLSACKVQLNLKCLACILYMLFDTNVSLEKEI